MSQSIATLLKYIKGNAGPCTRRVPLFRLLLIVSSLLMNEWSVASRENGFITRIMCIYCETVLWNSFVKTCSQWFYTRICYTHLLLIVNSLLMNEWSVASRENGFITRLMCIYCETVLWNSFVKTCSQWILYKNFQILCFHLISCYTKFDFKKFENETTLDDLSHLRWPSLVTSERKGDSKECHRKPYHIITMTYFGG